MFFERRSNNHCLNFYEGNNYARCSFGELFCRRPCLPMSRLAAAQGTYDQPKMLFVLVLVSKRVHVDFFLLKRNTCRFQNPDTQRAGRVGAAHGGTAGLGGAG